MKGYFFSIIVFVPIILSSCGNKLKTENEELVSKVDSLSSKLMYANEAIDVLTIVGATLDSIESEHDIIRMELLEGGISDEDYSKRILLLNDMLLNAEGMIGDLEKKNTQAIAIIQMLRMDLEEQSKTVSFLESVLETSRKENISLKQAVVRQGDQIADLEKLIEDKKQELALIEGQVHNMKIEATKSEAEAFYARAQAYEETANRTKLAPKKKKETLHQALELYKKSEDLGLEKAAEKVKELEGKVG